jgi:hypothetical protein
MTENNERGPARPASSPVFRPITKPLSLIFVMLMLKGSSQAWHATFLILQTYFDLFMAAALRGPAFLVNSGGAGLTLYRDVGGCEFE